MFSKAFFFRGVKSRDFLLLPQCFLKLSFPEVLKVGIVWYWVKQTASIFPITCLGLVLQNVYQPIPNNHVILRPWKKRLLETLCEKEDWHFPPFRNLFCPVGELQIICIKVGNVSLSCRRATDYLYQSWKCLSVEMLTI